MIFLVWFKQYFFNNGDVILKLLFDVFKNLCRFFSDIDASCFDNEESITIFFKILKIFQKYFNLVALGNILVEDINWHQSVCVKLWLICIS